MTRIIRAMAVAAGLSALVLAAGVQAADGPYVGNPAAGKDKAALCAGCHGDDGNSAAADFPRLASQYANYIVKQIMDFQKGLRTNNETMAGMAATVASVEDAKDIAAYFSQQKMAAKPIEPVKSDLADRGKKIFFEGNPESGLYACINCHGQNGKGKSATVSVFPVIGGQHRDYIMKELKDFREGRRSNDPAGMMSDIAKKLTDKEIEELANYLSSL